MATTPTAPARPTAPAHPSAPTSAPTAPAAKPDPKAAAPAKPAHPDETHPDAHKDPHAPETLHKELPGKPDPKHFGAVLGPDPKNPGQTRWAFKSGHPGIEKFKAAIGDWTAKDATYRESLAAGMPAHVAARMRHRAWLTGLAHRVQLGAPLDRALLTDPHAVDPSDFADASAYSWRDICGDALAGGNVANVGSDDIIAGLGIGLPSLDNLGLSDAQVSQRNDLAAQAKARQAAPGAPGVKGPVKVVVPLAQTKTPGTPGVSADQAKADALARRKAELISHLHAELVVARHATERDEALIHDLDRGLHAGAHALGVAAGQIEQQNAEIEARLAGLSANLGDAEVEGSDLLNGDDDLGRHLAHQAQGHETVAVLRHLVAQEHAKAEKDERLIRDLRRGAHALECCLAEAECYFEAKNAAVEARLGAKGTSDGTSGAEAVTDELGYGGGHGGGGHGHGHGRSAPGDYAPPVYAGPFSDTDDDGDDDVGAHWFRGDRIDRLGPMEWGAPVEVVATQPVEVVEHPLGWGRRLGWGRGRYGARWDGLGAHFERDLMNGDVGNFGSALAAVFTGGLSDVAKAAAGHPNHLEWVRKYGSRYYEHPEWRRLYWRGYAAQVEPGRSRALGRERMILGHERHEERALGREIGRDRRELSHERHEERALSREIGRDRRELSHERHDLRGVDDAPAALPALPPANLGAADPLCPTNACGLPPAGNYAPSALAGIGSPSLSAVSRSMRGDGLN